MDLQPTSGICFNTLLLPTGTPDSFTCLGMALPVYMGPTALHGLRAICEDHIFPYMHSNNINFFCITFGLKLFSFNLFIYLFTDTYKAHSP